MKIAKAVITAAGRSQRGLPAQKLVDSDGTEKRALQIIVEEVLAAGVDDVCVVVAPGDEAVYRDAAGPHAGRIHFVAQDEPRGYGHALYQARAFAGNQPFLHLVGDHLHISQKATPSALQVVETAQAYACSVSAVQSTREAMLPYYGVVGGTRVPRQTDLFEVLEVLEKPTPAEAEQRLLIPGLRAGQYLCFFGIHVFTPAVFELLQPGVAAGQADVQLSPVLDELAKRERYLALEVRGQRYNIGVRYGLFLAQLALALSGRDRAEVLAQMVELLATANASTQAPAEVASQRRS